MIDFIHLMDPKIIQLNKSDQYFEDNSWIMEPKINGRRVQCLLNNVISFAGRNARDGRENINNFAYKFFKIAQDLYNMDLPKNTLLDGEIYLPNGLISDTLQIINSGIDDAVRLQEEKGFLKYIIFDVIFFNNKSLINETYYNRRQLLKKIIQTTCNIELIKSYIKEQEKRSIWTQILNSTHEEKGVVFKFNESEYISLKSKWWRKLKNFETYDGVIIGFKFDKKYPNELVNSIKVAQYRNAILTEVANVSGLTNEQAMDFRSKIQYYTNKVIQFRSNLKTASSYKNAQFDHLRLDKEPENCMW